MDTPLAQPVPPPPPRNNSTIFIGILVFILGIVVGLVIDKTTLLSNIHIPYLSVTPTPTPLPTPTPTPDPTVNWETYTDLSGYTFLYPKEFQLEKLKNKVIIRIDPPDMRDVVGICPRYISFSSANSESFSKTSQDEYSCVYETKIENKKIFVESQYPKNERGIIDQILSTFKFLGQTTVTPTTTYTCPPSGYVDCMPGTSPKPECSPEAMAWYKANCPDFKGGAL